MGERPRRLAQIVAARSGQLLDADAEGEVQVRARVAVGDGKDVDGVDHLNVAFQQRAGVGESGAQGGPV